MSETQTAVRHESFLRGKNIRIALAGNPNCGKTALFNAITGGRAKVGNYPGVTVERKEGHIVSPLGLKIAVLDLPGTYSLGARTPDEIITKEVLLGQHPEGEDLSIIVAVVDASHLERNLGLVMELKFLHQPLILVLNMMDLALNQGLELDLNRLSAELDIPIIPTIATQGEGITELLEKIEELTLDSEDRDGPGGRAPYVWQQASPDEIQKRFAEIDRILMVSTKRFSQPNHWTERIDKVVLHPIWGSLLLLVILTSIFQLIFNWAEAPMDFIKDGFESLKIFLRHSLPNGALKSLLIDGVLTGIGSVIVFLPQILILFAFILFFEDTGYMARAAFLMDRLMGKVGLHGRAFIPLLSSFACAIPGIMATRTIENRRDRLVTILVAPLMTCSARLPIYSLIIAAFIPNVLVWGFFKLQGIVLLGLYMAGIAAGLLVALLLKHSLLKDAKPPLLLELPTYKWPSPKLLVIQLFEKGVQFIRRVGSVILVVSIVLWFLSSYPAPPAATAPEQPAIAYSFAGRIGKALEPLVAPIGFNWKIAVALIPGFMAREVMIGALATVYAVEEKDDATSKGLGPILAHDWSIATALSLLVWYVLACQCLSTLAVTYRETNSMRWPLFMLFYMTVLAYVGSWITYHVALRFHL